MNKLFIAFCLAFIFISCGDDNKDTPPNTILTDGYDENGIQIWDKKAYTFKNYTSSIGNINYISVYPSVRIKHKNNQNIVVEWLINNKMYDNIKEYQKWDAETSEWLTAYTSSIDKEYKFNFGDKIEATIFIDGKEIKREAVIKENKIVGDVYALKWGMTQKEVLEVERDRIKSNSFINPISPEIMRLGLCYNFPNVSYTATVYTFNNDKLLEVSEYARLLRDPSAEIYSVPEDFIEFCQKLGYKGPMDLIDGKLRETYTWNNSKAVFTIHQRTDMLQDYIGVSYRKYIP